MRVCIFKGKKITGWKLRWGAERGFRKQLFQRGAEAMYLVLQELNFLLKKEEHTQWGARDEHGMNIVLVVD